MAATTFVQGTTITSEWCNEVDQVVHDDDGAAYVGFTPSGTGAVATTVQAKLRESVSVKDFGAVGDGVTDDTAAIQAAFAHALAVRATSSFGVWKRSVSIYFPSGRYVVDATTAVVLSANLSGQAVCGISLVGDGYFSTHIDVTGSNYFLYNYNTLGLFSIEGITFNGITGDEKFFYSYSTGTAQNILRQNCSIYNFARLYVLEGTGNNDYFTHSECHDFQSATATESFYKIDNPQSVVHSFNSVHWVIQNIGIELNRGGEIRWNSGGILINQTAGCFLYVYDSTGLGIGYQNYLNIFHGLKVELRGGRLLYLKGDNGVDNQILFQACSLATRTVDPADAILLEKGGYVKFRDCVLDYKITVATTDSDLGTSRNPIVEIKDSMLVRPPETLITTSHTGSNVSAKGKVVVEGSIYRHASGTYPTLTYRPVDGFSNYALGFSSHTATERVMSYNLVGDARGLPSNAGAATFQLPKGCLVTRILLVNASSVADQWTVVGPSGATWLTSVASQLMNPATVNEIVTTTTTVTVTNLTSASLRNGYILVWYI